MSTDTCYSSVRSKSAASSASDSAGEGDNWLDADNSELCRIDPGECDASDSEVVKPSYRGVPAWKRVIDISLSGGLLVALSPVFFMVALYIKLVSKGPVLFCQRRVGAGGELFTILKFRTMNVRTDACEQHREYIGSLVSTDTPIEKPRHCSHLIPGGRILRSLSIDELPQLMNVFVGTMSLVGPRPDVLQLEDYQAWHLRRFEVLPGITGLWQVSGKNRLTFREMMELDISYVDGCSFTRDLTIMAKTFVVLLRRDNE